MHLSHPTIEVIIAFDEMAMVKAFRSPLRLSATQSRAGHLATHVSDNEDAAADGDDPSAL
jgi:hypothetical protein